MAETKVAYKVGERYLDGNGKEVPGYVEPEPVVTASTPAPPTIAEIVGQVISGLNGAKITDNQSDSVSDEGETSGFQSVANDAATQNKGKGKSAAPVSQDNG